MIQQMNKKGYTTTKSLILDTPVPVGTSTWKPVANSKLIDLTLESIDKAGFILDREFYSSAREGNQVTAKYTIKSLYDEDMQLMIGWQNSYDKTLSLKLCVGTQIFICSNGCVSGNMGAYKKKHVGDVQEIAPEKLVEYISGAGDTFYKMQQDKLRMKEIEVSKKVQAELLGRMFIEQEIITATQLGIIKKEIEAPTYDYNSKGSLWELYNYATFSLKEVAPSNWMKQHIDLHNFVTKEYSL